MAIEKSRRQLFIASIDGEVEVRTPSRIDRVVTRVRRGVRATKPWIDGGSAGMKLLVTSHTAASDLVDELTAKGYGMAPQ